MKFEINAGPSGRGAVLIDGMPAHGVAGAQVFVQVGEPTRVILDVNVIEVASVELDDVEVIIPDRTAETLVLLGWAPPIRPDGQDQDALG